MSYVVIARKWRPKTFDEIVGQLHVSQTLKNAIANKRIAHAYLFAGTRGIGKTTTARIMAKALNCVDGPTPEPCNQCIECSEISSGRAFDVIEIDGASNRGIDEVRELREKAVYAPSRGRYKIYIIDEVHMLTMPAFNALLKILEEPPKHIIFMFATTEINKVPITILSRCQCFDLKRISIQDIVNHLSMISEKEGIKIDKEDLFLIAKSAEGSMRDAQSLLDQIVSFGGKEIKRESVITILGIVDQEIFKGLMEGISKKDADSLLKIIQDLTLYGHDIGLFCRNLLEFILGLMITKASKDSYSLIELPKIRVDEMKDLASKFSTAELHQIFDILSTTEVEMRQSTDPLLPFEMALLKLTKIRSLKSVEDMIERLSGIEKSFTEKDLLEKSQSTKIFQEKTEEEKISLPEKIYPQEEKAESVEELEDMWLKVIKHSEKKKEWLPSVLEHLSPLSLKGDILELGFLKKNNFCIESIKENMALINEATREALGKKIKLKVNETVIEGKSEIKKEEEASKKDISEKEILKEAQDIFDAKVVEEKKITKK
ncbi:MAG TPA: DNA polymerase III subunit gamma/tau [Nitrospinota bacterium]|nr:DNA polymerase III subunit gamma/tau [Nitrospinota bacterium]